MSFVEYGSTRFEYKNGQLWINGEPSDEMSHDYLVEVVSDAMDTLGDMQTQLDDAESEISDRDNLIEDLDQEITDLTGLIVELEKHN